MVLFLCLTIVCIKRNQKKRKKIKFLSNDKRKTENRMFR